MISVKTTRPPRPRTSNESLRVVHVTGATGREGAGVTAAVEGMVAGLGTRPMVELSLVGICRPGEAWEARADFPARRIRVACRPPRIFSYAPGLQRLMDDLRPDIVHQHGIWQYSGIVSARLREARGVPLIVSPHGMLAPRAMAHRASRKRLAWWLYQRRALEAADVFHVTSERERDDVRALGLRQPVAVVPFGIDVPEACPVRTNSGPLTALFLSRIHPIKGILDLVHAWGQVRPAGWRLMIAGPDECGHTAEVAAAIKQLGLTESVSLRGACWDADRGCRWTVLINVPETGSWLAAPVASVNSLFAGDVPSPLRPLCSKPVFDWLVLVHPAPENPNTLLMGLATAGKPVPLPQTLLRKLALELDSSPPHETH